MKYKMSETLLHEHSSSNYYLLLNKRPPTIYIYEKALLAMGAKHGYNSEYKITLFDRFHAELKLKSPQISKKKLSFAKNELLVTSR